MADEQQQQTAAVKEEETTKSKRIRKDTKTSLAGENEPYIGVSSEYRNHAYDTMKPFVAAKGDNAKMEKDAMKRQREQDKLAEEPLEFSNLDRFKKG